MITYTLLVFLLSLPNLIKLFYYYLFPKSRDTRSLSSLVYFTMFDCENKVRIDDGGKKEKDVKGSTLTILFGMN